jgi:hypothetical protein
MSVFLENVANSQQDKGQLDDALVHFQEALNTYNQLSHLFGELPKNTNKIRLIENKIKTLESASK